MISKNGRSAFYTAKSPIYQYVTKLILKIHTAKLELYRSTAHKYGGEFCKDEE